MSGESEPGPREQRINPGALHGAQDQDDPTVCGPGNVWDRKKQLCLRKRSGVLPDSELTEYAFALSSADRFQEALDVLDMLDNSDTPRAQNYPFALGQRFSRRNRRHGRACPGHPRRDTPRHLQNSNDPRDNGRSSSFATAYRTLAWMAGTSPIRVKLRGDDDPCGVMPGLAPGIHADKLRVTT